ncbi:hypothetical protein SCE1572_20035 [Sorangium cellulosum So0157-2]|uniref:Uncharacterized protein n=1 Tax=Sorangium cellulosum So0157-2 TaxID=1254432 RepID=S4XW55_SORCE|nr:hypothetical protein SCE1572_20035 [Sorangium cellulosum So0157-2]
MSDRWSTPLPRTCSGDMYAGVPTATPVAVLWARASPASFATPKSSSLGKQRPLGSAATKMFSGFRSRCVIPAACAASSASAMPSRRATARPGERRTSRRISAPSVSPSSSSMTK